MPDWSREIRTRLGALSMSAEHEASIIEEMSQHLDDRYAELRGQGLDDAAAYAAALKDLSEPGQLERELRPVVRSPYPDPPRGKHMHFAWSEVRNAARGLLRSPTVTICAVLCLALGIGATTAISSAVSRALLQPLPFDDPDRLVAVHRTTPHSGPAGTWPQSAANYVDLAKSSTLIEGLSAVTFGSALISLPTEAIQASQLFVTGEIFQTLDIRPQLGRFILPEDDQPEAPLVAVLSDEMWRTRLGGDPKIVGSTLSIDGQQTTIVGIAPRDFRIPHGGQIFSAEVWMPLRLDHANLGNRRSNRLFLLGRLADGASVSAAETELRGLFANLVATYPQLNGENVRVAPLHQENVASVRTPLLLLFGAVCMVLLIAATNVAALLLARGVHRRREMAVRTALGASRWDTLRPMLIESFLLTVVSVVLGIGLAAAGVRTIGTLASERLPQLEGLALDWRVLGFALALSVIVALLCGAVPAWRSSSVDPQDALRGGRGAGADRGHHRALRSLVVLEIALSLVLLIGAGLVLKGFASLMSNEAGFDTDRTLTLRITASALSYPDGTGVPNFVQPVIEAIEAIPGVEAAGAINSVPYIQWGNNSNMRYEGQSADDPSSLPLVEQRAVTPSFFAVTEQRLIAGRLLDASDDNRTGAPPVVVVNEALVERDFKDRDPIGQRFHLTDTTLATIVGVVSDIRNVGPFREPHPEMYWSYLQSRPGAVNVPLMVRVSTSDPASIVPAVRAAVRDVDASAAVDNIATMDEVVARSLGGPRFYFSLLGTFAAIAIILAVAGLYGVLSYSIEQRTREIGIRAALGSSQAGLVRLFAMQGFVLVVLGVVLGLLGGMAVTRLMTFMLYGTSPLDAVAWAGAAAIMVVAGVAAAVVPALRAARVDPLVAIQVE